MIITTRGTADIVFAYARVLPSDSVVDAMSTGVPPQDHAPSPDPGSVSPHPNVVEVGAGSVPKVFAPLPERAIAEIPAVIQSVQNRLNFATAVLIFNVLIVMFLRAQGIPNLVKTILSILVLVLSVAASIHVFAPQIFRKRSGIPPLRVKKPRFLLVCAPHFNRLGFENDVRAVKNYYPNDEVVIHETLTSETIDEITSPGAHGKFDVVHIVVEVDSRTGFIVFSEDGTDRMAPEPFWVSFSRLEPKLVVFSTCDALKPAIRVARDTNCISGANELPVNIFKIFCEFFYEDLSRGMKISEAFDRADSRVGRNFVIFLKQEAIAPRTGPLLRQIESSREQLTPPSTARNAVIQAGGT